MAMCCSKHLLERGIISNSSIINVPHALAASSVVARGFLGAQLRLRAAL
jgi:hypothetical protein